MREPENIRQVAALPVQYMGFIFYKVSARYVGQDFSVARDWPESVRRVGVFVNASEGEILRNVERFSLTTVQLHGAESPELAFSLRQKQLEVLKAFSIAEANDIQQTAHYEDCCDYFLFDTKTPLYGGSGKSFDWDVLSGYKGKLPFFLSGGIGPDDVERLRQFRHPFWAGIDLNSKFEQSSGCKDAAMISAFINQIRQFNF